MVAVGVVPGSVVCVVLMIGKVQRACLLFDHPHHSANLGPDRKKI